MTYIIIGVIFTLAELLIFGTWIPRATSVSYFLCSYNLVIWFSLVFGTWVILSIVKSVNRERLSWKATLVTLIANIAAIILSIPSTEGDKITAIMFGVLFFLVPSVLGTMIITGLSAIFQRKMKFQP